jgi:hypothetical protein
LTKIVMGPRLKSLVRRILSWGDCQRDNTCVVKGSVKVKNILIGPPVTVLLATVPNSRWGRLGNTCVNANGSKSYFYEKVRNVGTDWILLYSWLSDSRVQGSVQLVWLGCCSL